MKEMKGTIKIFMMSLLLMLISAVTAFAAKPDDIETPLRLYNEGFEEPGIEGTYKQIAASDVPYWRSTAVTSSGNYNQIELFKQNKGTFLPDSRWLVPREGAQGAELNSQEESTMYQYVYGSPGSVYEWGVSHHGRANCTDPAKKDVMAIFIGPKQVDDNGVTIDPAKKGGKSTGRDQFMRTVDWLLTKKVDGLNVSTLEFGDCKAFEVYTTKFAENGEFVGGDANAISLTKTDTHTEKWHVWIIASDNDAWYDYGVTAAEDCVAYGDNTGYNTHEFTNTSYESNNTFNVRYKMPDYNYHYTVPSGSNGTIYAYCAYETASADASKRLTIGNIIDYARFSIKAPVRVTTTDFGSAETTISDENSASENFAVNSSKPLSTYTAAGNTIKLNIVPEEKCKFVGVYVNNAWIPASDSTFSQNEDGTYTYSDTVTDGMNSFHVVFAKYPYIIHSPNGGTYKDSTTDTAEEITGEATHKYSESPIIANGGRFTYWSIVGTDATVSANHTIDVEDGSVGKYNITVSDENGSIVAEIKDTDVVVLIAHYEYPQIVNIYTMFGGKWENSNTGGDVTISCSDVPVNALPGATRTIYVEDNTEVTVEAYPNENYHLERIVSDTTVQKESTYVYYSVGPREISVYYISGKRKPVVAFVDENGIDSWVLDTNTDTKTKIQDKGGAYGNTVSTAFTAFWAGDETYTHIQWIIDISLDRDTFLKSNSLTAAFTPDKAKMTVYKQDTEAADKKIQGNNISIYRRNRDKTSCYRFPNDNQRSRRGIQYDYLRRYIFAQFNGRAALGFTD